jgi:hypothetical protein
MESKHIAHHIVATTLLKPMNSIVDARWIAWSGWLRSPLAVSHALRNARNAFQRWSFIRSDTDSTSWSPWEAMCTRVADRSAAVAASGVDTIRDGTAYWTPARSAISMIPDVSACTFARAGSCGVVACSAATSKSFASAVGTGCKFRRAWSRPVSVGVYEETTWSEQHS